MIAIVEPMIPRLRRYARALMRDGDDADELVQDCLERAFARWHQRRSGGSAHGWMFAILHNLAMNRLRQRARHGQALSVDTPDLPLPADRPRQEDAMHRRDILAMMDLLPDEQRSVLLLVALEELSYAEVATMLDVPIGTVMSRLSRGRERLRRLLAGGMPAARPELKRVK